MNKDYKTIIQTLPYLLDGITNNISILANTSALLKEYMEGASWVGFYMFEDGKLILGPFQGKVACSVIDINRGVCGECYRKKETVIVKNVHLHPDHIACDAGSNSELVVPLIKKDVVIGVLDIDSYNIGEFDEEDKINLIKIVDILLQHLN